MHKPVMRRERRRKGKEMKRKMMAAVLIMAMTAGVLGGCGNSTGNNAKTDTNAQNNANTAEIKENANADVTEIANADGTVYKVGIVQYVDDASLNQIEKAIEAELDAKGAELGVTFDYADYTYNGQADSSTLNQIATDLVAEKVDVIIPIATPAAMIMQNATEDNQIPVVFSAVSDPVGAGLVESLEAPGANLTGTSDYLDTASIMKLIEAVNPDTKKIGLLYDIGQDSSTAAIEAAKAYMDENGIEYVERTGTTTDEVQLAADALVADGVDAVFTPTDNTIMTAELSIYEKFIDAGIPHYTGADSFALNGAFAGYGVDYANLGAKTADMVADILLNGADPATTPVETFDNGTATVNTETCEGLGLDFETVKAAMEPLCTQVNEIVTAESFNELETN
jgi:putative ABC transport system substrate-binding protein